MDDGWDVIAVFLVMLILGLGGGYIVGHYLGYKEGQIAAINGKIGYELKVQEDKSIYWERIGE
jgi:hypothetical protein